jgi:hypothetical protein
MRRRTGGRDGADVTLEEFVVAVERHRLQMALLTAELDGVIDDDASRELVGMLKDSDGELDRLCQRLSRSTGGSTYQQEGSSHGREERRGADRRGP